MDPYPNFTEKKKHIQPKQNRIRICTFGKTEPGSKLFFKKSDPDPQT